MKKKVIFLLYSLSVGGAERRAASIANYLVDNGFDVEILLMDSPNVCFDVDKRVKIVFLHNVNFDSWIDVSSNRVEVFKVSSKPVSINSKLKLKILKMMNNKQYLALEQLEYLKKQYSNKIYEYIKNKPDYTVISWMTFVNISTCYALKDTGNQKIIVECMSPEAEFPAGHYINVLKEEYYPYAKKVICQTPDEADYYDYLTKVQKYVIPNPVNGSYPNRYTGERKKASNS